MTNNYSTFTYILIVACFIIPILGIVLLRKMANHDHKTMLEAQDFALNNPEQIAKIKLVDGSEVFCVVTLKDQKSVIVAQGVQAVRVFDKLIVANPRLA